MAAFSGLSLGAEELKTYLEPEFRPRLPEIMAQGTSFTANAHGFGSLFTNPAGFAMKGGDFTLLATNAALRLNPFQFQEDMQALNVNPQENPMGLIDVFSRQLGSGIGASSYAGMGVVGKGLGIGLITTVEADAQGKTLMGTEAPVYGTFALPIGFAINLEPVENYKLAIGGDIRPMYRMAVETNAQQLLSLVTPSKEGEEETNPLEGVMVRSGTALAFDVGAILQLDTLKVGLSVRDLFGTPFKYSNSSLQSYLEDTEEEPVEVEDTYLIPMMARLGVAYAPHFDIFILSDPVLHAEYEIPFIPLDSAGEPIEDPGSVYTHLNMGGEIKFLKFIAIQGGLTSGYLTGGIGIDLLFIELNLAGYTEEYGPHAGDNPGSGVSVEVALRF